MRRRALARLFDRAYVVDALIALSEWTKPTPMTVADVAKAMGPSHQRTALGLVKHLAAHGVVELGSAPGKHRIRVHAVALSEEGAELVATLLELDAMAEKAAQRNA